MFPQGEGSAVIHRKKNDLIYQFHCTYLSHSIWQGEFLCSSKQVVNRLAHDSPWSLHTVVSPVE